MACLVTEFPDIKVWDLVFGVLVPDPCLRSLSSRACLMTETATSTSVSL